MYKISRGLIDIDINTSVHRMISAEIVETLTTELISIFFPFFPITITLWNSQTVDLSESCLLSTVSLSFLIFFFQNNFKLNAKIYIKYIVIKVSVV